MMREATAPKEGGELTPRLNGRRKGYAPCSPPERVSGKAKAQKRNLKVNEKNYLKKSPTDAASPSKGAVFEEDGVI